MATTAEAAPEHEAEELRVAPARCTVDRKLRAAATTSAATTTTATATATILDIARVYRWRPACTSFAAASTGPFMVDPRSDRPNGVRGHIRVRGAAR